MPGFFNCPPNTQSVAYGLLTVYAWPLTVVLKVDRLPLKLVLISSSLTKLPTAGSLLVPAYNYFDDAMVTVKIF
jgi:hypothetical protein